MARLTPQELISTTGKGKKRSLRFYYWGKRPICEIPAGAFADRAICAGSITRLGGFRAIPQGAGNPISPGAGADSADAFAATAGSFSEGRAGP